MSDSESPPEVRRRHPAGATIRHWTARDGWRLRVFDWPAAGTPRGSILFQGGRGDFIEKYLESFAHWHAQGWRLTAFDWRGQAGSGRTTPQPHVGHIDDFGLFIDDLHDFWAAWADGAERPRVAIGHSMGGHLILRAMVEGAIVPNAAVLVAPMLGLHAPIGPRFGEAVARALGALGKPTRAAWKGNERPYTLAPRRSLLTHDISRYEDERWWQAQDAALVTGPPSWRWVTQGFASTRILNASPDLATMATPVLMLVAEADKLVDPGAAFTVAARLPDARVVRFGAESAHEILREAASVRDRALAEIDAFLSAAGNAQGMKRFDIAIVGGGIAGATLAAEVAPQASVVLLEAEDAAGYHATGRSAAFWSETYGGPHVQPLTSASGDALSPYLSPLGSLQIGRAEDAALMDAFLAEFDGSGVDLRRVDPAAYIPGLRSEWTLGVIEPSCAYIDVAALHADALRRLKRAGGDLWLSAGFETAARQGSNWTIDTAVGRLAAGILVDAAGAWADAVAARAGVRPVGIQPYRRTLAQLRVDPPVPEAMPHVADIAGSFYWKPEAGGKLWLSPADETPTDPCDAAAEEIDVAIAIDRMEGAVDWRVQAVERKWAGLRSFAPDRLPVYGFDRDVAGFFWCAGQGGFGIQTAPAAARLAAALLLGAAPDPSVAGIDPAVYAPDRFGTRFG